MNFFYFVPELDGVSPSHQLSSEVHIRSWECKVPEGVVPHHPPVVGHTQAALGFVDELHLLAEVQTIRAREIRGNKLIAPSALLFEGPSGVQAFVCRAPENIFNACPNVCLHFLDLGLV